MDVWEMSEHKMPSTELCITLPCNTEKKTHLRHLRKEIVLVFVPDLRKTFTHLYAFLFLNKCFFFSSLNQFSLSPLYKLLPLQIMTASALGSP